MGEFFVELSGDDVELVDVGEDGEDEDIDDDDTLLKADFAQDVAVGGEPAAGFAHGLCIRGIRCS